MASPPPYTGSRQASPAEIERSDHLHILLPMSAVQAVTPHPSAEGRAAAIHLHPLGRRASGPAQTFIEHSSDTTERGAKRQRSGDDKALIVPDHLHQPMHASAPIGHAGSSQAMTSLTNRTAALRTGDKRPADHDTEQPEPKHISLEEAIRRANAQHVIDQARQKASQTQVAKVDVINRGSVDHQELVPVPTHLLKSNKFLMLPRIEKMMQLLGADMVKEREQHVRDKGAIPEFTPDVTLNVDRPHRDRDEGTVRSGTGEVKGDYGLYLKRRAEWAFLYSRHLHSHWIKIISELESINRAIEKQVDIVVEGHRRRQPQCNYASVTNGAQLDAHCKAVHEANSIARSDVMIVCSVLRILYGQLRQAVKTAEADADLCHEIGSMRADEIWCHRILEELNRSERAVTLMVHTLVSLEAHVVPGASMSASAATDKTGPPILVPLRALTTPKPDPLSAAQRLAQHMLTTPASAAATAAGKSAFGPDHWESMRDAYLYFNRKPNASAADRRLHAQSETLAYEHGRDGYDYLDDAWYQQQKLPDLPQEQAVVPVHPVTDHLTVGSPSALAMTPSPAASHKATPSPRQKGKGDTPTSSVWSGNELSENELTDSDFN